MSFMIIGDPHFGKGSNIAKPNIGDLHSRDYDKVFLFKWALKKCLENQNKTNNIIITGDIFEDYNPGLLLIKTFFQFVIEHSDFNFFIIPGNHDLKRTGNNYLSVLDILNQFKLNNVFIYNNISSVIIDNSLITFLPFKDIRGLNVKSNIDAVNLLKKHLSSELNKYKNNEFIKKKVLIGHLALEGSLYIGDEIDDLQNEIFCPKDMFEGYDYVFMGHIHKPQVMCESPIYQAHIGSLDISDFGEINHEKIIIYFDENRKNQNHINISVPTRPLRHISVVVPDGLDPQSYVSSEIIKFDKITPLVDSTVKLTVKIEDKKSPLLDRKKIEELIYKLGTHYLCEFSEFRASHIASTKLASLSSSEENDDQMTSLAPEEVFKLWINLQKISDDDKSFILDTGLSLIKEIKASA